MRLHLFTTIAEKATHPKESPFVSFPPSSPPTLPPVSRTRTELLSLSPHPCSSRSQPSAMGDPKREAYPKPPQMPGPGSSLQADLPQRAGSRTPARVPSRRCAPHPASLQHPASQLRQTKPHAPAAAALRAPTRPGPAREEGARTRGGNAQDPPRPRCERGGGAVTHSMK